VSEPYVEAKWSSIERVWRAKEGNDVWLMLKSKNASVDQLNDAIGTANDAADASVGYAEVVAEGPAPVKGGLAFMFKRATSKIGLHVWVDTLCEELERAGITGTVAGAPGKGAPDWISQGKRPVAFSTWVISPEAQTTQLSTFPYWRVGPELTLRLTTLADSWARIPNGTLFLTQGTYTVELPIQDVNRVLATSLPHDMNGGVTYAVEAERRAKVVSLFASGDAIFHDVDPAKTWNEVIASLTGALTTEPASMRHGFIRFGLSSTVSGSQIYHAQALEGIREPDYRYNMHLYDDYLPDAHGVQVVQTAHLNSAADLSGWNITDLGHGRHLVQAPDLEPWYAHGLPDADVLARARRDWAGALLTKEIITANPCPWID